jgi:hypothetical protein
MPTSVRESFDGARILEVVVAYSPPKYGSVSFVTGCLWALSALFGLLAIGRVFVAGQGTPGWEWPQDALLVFGACVAAGLAAFAASGTGGRRRFAYPAAIAELSICVLLCVGGGVLLAISPADPPGTDGNAYAAMGAVSWAFIFVIFLTVLLTSAGRRAFRAPPAGWYADPAGERPWRWWDGATWTEHVG